MTQAVSTLNAEALRRKPLSQIVPFDEGMLRQCIAYLSHGKQRSFTQLYVVKFSVLIDLFHLMSCGKPVIGGSVAPWESGPVVEEAYRACSTWRADFDRFGRHPAGLRVTSRTVTKVGVGSAASVDFDEFSQTEVDAMEQAWGEIGHLNYDGLRHYTRSPNTYLGASYFAARREERLMGWDDIIESYDRFRATDHSAVQALIRL